MALGSRLTVHSMRASISVLASSSLLASVLLVASPPAAFAEVLELPPLCVEVIPEVVDEPSPTESAVEPSPTEASPSESAVEASPDESVEPTVEPSPELSPEPSASETESVEPTLRTAESLESKPESTDEPDPSPSSQESDSATDTPVIVCPDPVTDLALTPKDRAIDVSWAPVADDVTDIWVQVTPDGTVTRLGADAAGMTVTGLRNGVEYAISVTTSNENGTSESILGRVTPSIDGPAEVAGLVVAFSGGVDAREGSTHVPGEQAVTAAGLTVGENLGSGLHRVDLSEPVPASVAEEIARELASDASVVSAEPDYLLLPAAADSAWNLNGDFGIDLPAAIDPAVGAGSTVAIIDTGSTDHPDLRWGTGRDFVSNPDGLGGDRAGEAAPFDGDYVDEVRFGGLGWDDNAQDPGDWRTGRDSTWHGTAVAGIVAAAAPGSTIVPVRAMSWRGGLLSDIAAGITWASGASVGDIPGSSDPADVIVLSLAAQATCTPVLQQAISAATERGSLVVAAAGNGNADASGYLPASCGDVLTVGSSTIDGTRADYSNYGSAVDLSAPGGTVSAPVSVLSNSGARTPDSSSTSTSFGTSIAAAHVAGIAAAYRASAPEKTPADVAGELSKQVQPFAGGACDVEESVTCGSGIVLAQVAVTTTDIVVANYPIGDSPQKVRLTADETKAVVAAKDGDSVSVVTTADGTTVTYAVNPDPVFVAIKDSSTAYISHSGSSVVTVIDLADTTSSAVSTVNFGTCATPGDIAYHSNKVYLACSTETRVWDGTTFTSIAAPADRFSVTSNYVYTSKNSYWILYRITPSDGTVTDLGNFALTDRTGFAVNPDESMLFKVNGDNYLTQFRLSDATSLKHQQATEVRRATNLDFVGSSTLHVFNDEGRLTTLSYTSSTWTWLRNSAFCVDITTNFCDYRAGGMDVTADGSFAWIAMTASINGGPDGGYLRKVALAQTTSAAPSGLTATNTNGGASIAFTPGNPGSGAVTNYEYRVYSGGSWGAWTAFSPAVTASPAVITGLTNGTSYLAQLRAITDIGTGDSSNSVSFVAGQPAAPTSLSAAVTTTAATITFTPGADGGSPITNYEYAFYSGGAWGAWTALSPAGTTSPVTITGLTPNTWYTIGLRAVTSIASGVTSAARSFRTSALTAPSAPTTVAATPSTTSAVVSFTAGSDGGSSLLRFEYSLDSGTTWMSAGTTTSPITVTGLASGTAYSLLVRGVNGVGNGTASSAVTFTTTAVSSGSSSSPAAPVVTIPEAVLVAPIPPTAPVTVPSVGSAVVTVNGRDIPVNTRKTTTGTWRVSAPDFSLEFTPVADAVAEQAQFICPAGSWVQIDGDGFAPGATVSAYLFSTRLRSGSDDAAVLGRGTVQSDGSVQVRADVPRGTDLGRFTLQVSGLGPDGAVRVVNMGMEVVAGAPVIVKERTAAAAFFSGGSARFSSPGKARLRSLVASLPLDRGEVRINVSAVATSREDFDANLTLATQRARKIQALLDRRGVDGAVTVTLTTGTTVPEEGVFARSSKGKLLTTVTVGYEVKRPS